LTTLNFSCYTVSYPDNDSPGESLMHVIAYAKLREFSQHHSTTKTALERWYKTLSKTHFQNFEEWRRTFSNSVDQVGKCVVFNVGGNEVRVIVKILYSIQTVYIKSVLTHAEYDMGQWKTECDR
jgi:mRNA interferase HigB